ncbi:MULTISPECIES: DUF4982 domain-containing protein [unclassified Streptomyces]|uniref:DUF4982 domain-containing protein n=1 Tax=unclassified Streptomyces TaxID=2593676 RepID=UPI001F19F905|nr:MULTISPECIES: DUF4982 domain-containing protein [unclassified Streptomyces]MCF0086699.1 hypothetical protein [Streptomyces sp. MH192]MCF0098853.1 hypothetical protein [Streptomyces sp. MH191]
MEQPYDPELVADIDEAFLGYWPEDLADIFTRPYEPGALTAYAYRDGGAHIPQDGGQN